MNVQVKICGLTRPDEALACARLGADAVGCVFYPPSPRHVSRDLAKRIADALRPTGCGVVGVFVDAPLADIVPTVTACGLTAVQLHGRESPELVRRLGRRGIRVIKGLFVNAAPAFIDASTYDAWAFLAECAGGPLPGGNAKRWDWAAAKPLAATVPLVLAGGLTPDNVAEAVAAALPAAIDVSSGVEATPGRKDLTRVKRFLDAVARIGGTEPTRRIFP